MKFFVTHTTDPTYNLALEEALLRNYDEDIFFLWRNAPSVIIGRNQNAYSEINLEYSKEKGIAVVRRSSGGGAVYHDLGNINYSFITHAREGLSFETFTAPIIEYLRSLGVEAGSAGRNDIEINGQKISGAAQAQIGQRFLHHGTLLFSAKLTDLSQVLAVHPLKIKSKGIASVRARVTNISEHLPKPMTAEEFMTGLAQFVCRGQDADAFSDKDLSLATSLQQEKYGVWEWNFGRNPDYAFCKAAKFDGGLIEVKMNIAEERIRDIQITGDFLALGEMAELEETLRGLPHRYESIYEAIKDLSLHRYLGTISAEQLLTTMF